MEKQEFNLDSIPKKNIFQVPENYFEDLSAKIEQRTQSVVENLPKENIFKVPENYFEDLESKILARTSEKTKIIPLFTWSAKRTWASVASCEWPSQKAGSSHANEPKGLVIAHTSNQVLSYSSVVNVASK